MTASLLNLPCATQVMELSLDAECENVSVEREVEAGRRERLELRLPALLTLQSGINRPRYPSLSNLLRANRQPVDVFAASPDEKVIDPVVCVGLMRPPRTRAGRVLEGSLQAQAEAFLSLLREKAWIR
jgi:electron transfer flavoprotein beta subunit